MRNRHLAAIPLAALLLTACASATDTVPLTTPTPEPTATATPTPAAGDFAWLNRHESSFNSGDAYYEMVYRNHGGLLLKTDYATAAQTVACTVPGCTHDSADCPAWFPGRYSYYCPFVADGAVYVLNASFFHTDQTWEEYRKEYLTPQLDSTDLTPEELEAHYYGLWQQQSAAPQVYRLTDDGKTCIDLPAECVDYVFDFCDDAALYGVMTSGNNGQNTKAVRVDLTTGELQSVPLEPTEYFVTCYDGALLTVRYVTDAPLPDDFEQFRAAVQSATVEFDRYDPRTGERRKPALLHWRQGSRGNSPPPASYPSGEAGVRCPPHKICHRIPAHCSACTARTHRPQDRREMRSARFSSRHSRDPRR